MESGDILDKEIESWKGFEYAPREENRALFNKMLSKKEEYADCMSATGEIFSTKVLFMIHIYEQQKMKVSDRDFSSTSKFLISAIPKVSNNIFTLGGLSFIDSALMMRIREAREPKLGKVICSIVLYEKVTYTTILVNSEDYPILMVTRIQVPRR